MSEATDVYLAELEAAEAQAAGLLDNAEAEADPKFALARRLRETVRRHRNEVDRIREEARTEARLELIRERQTEAGFRRLAVPASARALFGDVDATDPVAMAARAEELREAGITWPDQPAPEPPEGGPEHGCGRCHAGGRCRRHHRRLGRRPEGAPPQAGGQSWRLQRRGAGEDGRRLQRGRHGGGRTGPGRPGAAGGAAARGEAILAAQAALEVPADPVEAALHQLDTAIRKMKPPTLEDQLAELGIQAEPESVSTSQEA